MDAIDAPLGRGPFIGRGMPRFEDLRFVRGGGNYTDDVSVPEQAHAAFVRAPHAHARIVSIDASAARRRPGVLAVLVGEDYTGDGHIGMAHLPNPADANDVKIPTFAATPGRKVFDQLHLPLAIGCVRFVGEAVAMVVAQTPAAAREGAEAVVIEYEVLPAVTDVMEALADGAPTIWAEAPGNLALDCAFGDRAAVESAIAGAHLVVDATIRNPRTASPFMDPHPTPPARLHGPARVIQQPLPPGPALSLALALPGRAPPAARARGLPQTAARARARDLSRCRRRVRLALQHLSGAAGGRLGVAPRGTPREMDGRSQRGVSHRLYRARRRHARAACLQPPRT